ncbi:MAG TPA: asparagine synthase (glutamine-hydrolyzing), partial [Tepidisphaeraceae bacterium]|nr:asparagine synthase (glutamine-hydrolyzing) [Tepidisphaeraceae bacterium]
MCGIAGYVQRRPPPDGTIDRMIAQLEHRGPDGSGVWHGQKNGWSIALGHRRLAIIDIEGGKQPLANEDRSVWITFNGEIYNFAQLRDDLQNVGHCFATHCDTEAIVHHYEQHGAGGLDQFNGMFAFAIWDSNAGQLLLARDRIGIKPLYFAPLSDGGIAFASELTALLAHPEIDRTLDIEGLTSYFFLDYAHPPHSLVRGAKKLQPGHSLLWTVNGLDQPKQFVRIASSSDPHSPPPKANEAAEMLLNKLNASVKSQLMSDVPVGVFLSGGIDSSMVAALAQWNSSRQLTTFSIGFEDPQYDESRYARLAATRLGTCHIEQTFTEAALLRSLDEALD